MATRVDVTTVATDVVARLHSLSRSLADRAPEVLAGRADLDDLVGVVGDTQDLMNVLAGLQTVALAHVAATSHEEREDGTVEVRRHGLGHVREDGGDLVAGDLGCTANAAEQRVEDAVALVTKAVPIVRAQLDGRLDAWKARIAVVELADADGPVAREVSHRVLAGLGAAVRTTGAGAFRSRLRRTLTVVDADAVARRARLARTNRCLRRFTGEPGVTGWEAVLPAEEAALAWAAIDEVARGYRQQGLVDTLDAARADALMDLILGRTAATVQLTIAVPAGSMTVDPLRGYMPVTGLPGGPSDLPVAWLERLAGSADRDTSAPRRSRAPRVGEVAARVRVVECDPATGLQLTAPTAPGATRVEQPRESAAYAVPESLKAFVDGRDGGCRFPGCATGSRHCDKDHLVPWPVGPTAADNLSDVCRHHHRVKQQVGWSVARAPDGSLTWTDPLGRRRSSQGTDHLGVTLDLPGPPGARPAVDPPPPDGLEGPIRARTRASAPQQPDADHARWLTSAPDSPLTSALEGALMEGLRRDVREANRATPDLSEQRRRRGRRGAGPFGAGQVTDRLDRRLDRSGGCHVDTVLPERQGRRILVDLTTEPPF